MPVNEIQKSECPNCGENAVVFADEIQRFPYENDGKTVELSATVPVGRCQVCNVGFTDERGEILRHEAVCAHLGVYSPKEIIALRKKWNLSRRDLAEATKIGEASIARWERGEVIQNQALDQLLYLLDQCGNLTKLRARQSRSNPVALAGREPNSLLYRFPDLCGDRLDVAEEGAKHFAFHR